MLKDVIFIMKLFLIFLSAIKVVTPLQNQNRNHLCSIDNVSFIQINQMESLCVNPHILKRSQCIFQDQDGKQDQKQKYKYKTKNKNNRKSYLTRNFLL